METQEAYMEILDTCYGKSRFSVKTILLSYISNSWDIAYLYLYQCIEDEFVRYAINGLYTKLELSITIDNFYALLYDETQWQPRDIESVDAVFSRISKASIGIEKLKSVCGDMKTSKWIYKLRNSIVHQTHEALIPTHDDAKWNTVIHGVLTILTEICSNDTYSL